MSSVIVFFIFTDTDCNIMLHKNLTIDSGIKQIFLVCYYNEICISNKTAEQYSIVFKTEIHSFFNYNFFFTSVGRDFTLWQEW